MVVACSYKILWPKIDFWHILACFGPFLECKNAQNWNGRPTIVYGSINLKIFLGGPDTYKKLPCEDGSPNPKIFFFGPGYWACSINIPTCLLLIFGGVLMVTNVINPWLTIQVHCALGYMEELYLSEDDIDSSGWKFNSVAAAGRCYSRTGPILIKLAS